MNIQEALAANRCIILLWSPGGSRPSQQAKDGNFHVPGSACATERAL